MVGISWNEQAKGQETTYMYVICKTLGTVANPKLKVSLVVWLTALDQPCHDDVFTRSLGSVKRTNYIHIIQTIRI
jgi:hypothetical protein